VPDICTRHYSKPYRFRQNESTVSMSMHFDQLIQHARGEYFLVLPDDDELSPNYVSELLSLMEKYPDASAAFGKEETLDEGGRLIRTSKDTIPEIMSGVEFIRTTWGSHKYGLEGLCTFLAKREDLLACGGWPDIWAGTSDEDLLAVKLSLGSRVAFSTRCSYRKRFYETSSGYAINMKDLERGIREFVSSLDSDGSVQRYASAHKAEWTELRGYLVGSAWDTYYYRWEDMYRKRLSPWQWTVAGFALPPAYYRRVARTVLGAAKQRVLGAATTQR
jgi:hypothetical protein